MRVRRRAVSKGCCAVQQEPTHRVCGEQLVLQEGNMRVRRLPGDVGRLQERMDHRRRDRQLRLQVT